MIVAPLMTPILGTVLSTVTADGRNLFRSVALVVTGAAAVVVVGMLIGLLVPVAIDQTNNAQVAGRVHPQLFDLLAALATGIVGSFALVRSDVSATLPGVAIAISLVPPLAVVGLTLESGAGSQSAGALLLFLTNVAAILVSGLVVLALYRVFRIEHAFAVRGRRQRRVVTMVVAAFVVVLVVPLAASTVRISTDAVDRANVAPVAKRWAEADGWLIAAIASTDAGVQITASGGLPGPDPRDLRDALDAAGLDDVDVVVDLVPSAHIELPAGTPPSRVSDAP
jgi:uncharacterized hydrophobic protein (TIGR00271 family)